MSGPLRGGIDLGGTKIQTVIVDDANKVLGEARQPTPATEGAEAVATAMTAALTQAADAAGVETDALAGVGAGTPGSPDPKTGVVSGSPNIAGWDGFALGQRLAETLGTTVKVGNDVQVATAAEAQLGAAREFRSILGVFWGTGVGGGLILDGTEWLGRGAAGEIGHMVVKRGGARCPCGNRGCVEAYAGRAAMEAEARKRQAAGEKTGLFDLMTKHGHDRLTSGIWERAVKAEDHLAMNLLDRAVKALGAGIASAVNLLDVEVVILGGGLGVRFAERYGPSIEKAMLKSLVDADDPPAFRAAELGDLGGAIGAASLVRR